MIRLIARDKAHAAEELAKVLRMPGGSTRRLRSPVCTLHDQ